jgi:glycolate oxidase FAD binding subunit
VRYGRCRDHLLGFRAVNGFGEAYKGGGKVVKNVTGFDLPKLFCGAMGTLGPLTEVTLRVFPRPELEWLIAVKDLAPEYALALMRAILASPISPTALCYVPAINYYTSPRVPRNLPELSHIGAGAVLVRLDGSGAALAEKRAALRALAGHFHLVDLAGENSIRRIDAGSMFENSPLDVWRFDVPTTSVVPLIAKDQPAEWAADWGGSRVYVARTPGHYGQREHAYAAQFEGRCILFRASAETRKRAQVFGPNTESVSALITRVKAAFDPLRLFNPGRMWEGV